MKRITYRATARKTLMAFDGGKSARMADLAAKVERSKSCLCRTLKKLVQVGHVQRVKLDRHLVFCRTPHGEALVNAWLNCGGRPPRSQKSNPVTPADVMRN